MLTGGQYVDAPVFRNVGRMGNQVLIGGARSAYSEKVTVAVAGENVVEVNPDETTTTQSGMVRRLSRCPPRQPERGPCVFDGSMRISPTVSLLVEKISRRCRKELPAPPLTPKRTGQREYWSPSPFHSLTME